MKKQEREELAELRELFGKIKSGLFKVDAAVLAEIEQKLYPQTEKQRKRNNRSGAYYDMKPRTSVWTSKFGTKSYY